MDELLALISIHSPRMGRDDDWLYGNVTMEISIHSPRMGRDMFAEYYVDCPEEFQSTLPAWGETFEILLCF